VIGYFSRRLIQKVHFTPVNEMKFLNYYKNVPKFASFGVLYRKGHEKTYFPHYIFT
jgi:hypothetical protein